MSHLRADRLFSIALAFFAMLAALLLLLVIFFLGKETAPLFRELAVWRLVSDEGWYPLEGQFGLLPMLLATVLAALGALVLAAPLGVMSALFMRFYAPLRLSKSFHLMLALLAGIPSVIYGLWGLTVLAPLIGRWQAPGVSLLCAILILTLMILPTIALTSLSALKSVPTSLTQGAAALGLSRKAMLLAVVIPAARRGIVSGVLLASVRALGETMAVLMVAGNVVQSPSSLFDPVRVLTANIALEMAYATGDHRAGLFASGLLLTMLVLLLAWMAARLSRGTYV